MTEPLFPWFFGPAVKTATVPIGPTFVLLQEDGQIIQTKQQQTSAFPEVC